MKHSKQKIPLVNASATLAFGEQLGREAIAGQVIALVGDLGVGKTTLTQGVMRGLGYTGEVTSPTFSLVQEYKGERLEVFHFDFYRVEYEHELIELGWDDFVERGGLVIVEWPGLFPQLLPLETRWLELIHSEDGKSRELREIDAL
ncbi:tRNA (adenosine(37)-N6)-threonylcarbamoyltransferase complex ATPase subunit type 1 TsaE [Akkermansiaceae bacterium]|nr:tRNA (adenosine(37)-N6)-threonylcarbamoyltransferase complex ATPase subunit type 1 TsaE [Akkermansiaceae bacterium]